MKGFTRPEMTVLSESSAIPQGHLVEPPEEFTHEVVHGHTYSYDRASASANGTLAAGTKVRLLDEDDATSRVVDPRGLIVTIEKSALRKLKNPQS
jgi:hypothetical protein